MTDQQFIKISFGDAARFLIRGFLPALGLAVLAAAAAYLLSRESVPLYRSTAILLATQPGSAYSSTANIMEPAQVDPAIYRSAIVEGGLLEKAIARVTEEEPSSDELAEWRKLVKVRVDENLISGLVRIQVENRDPALAADVANSLADSLLSWDRDRVSRNIQATVSSLDRSLVVLAAQIAAEEQTGDNDSAQVLRATREQRLSQLRSAEALGLSAIVIGLLEPFQTAAVEETPVNQQNTFTVVIAFLLAFVLAYAFLLLRRLTDPRVRDAADLARASGLEPSATIPGYNPRPQFTEAVSRLAISLPLQYPHDRLTNSASSSRGVFIVVTSPTGQYERSLLARHLASAYASSGWRVLLVDADLVEGGVSASIPAAKQLTPLTDFLRYPGGAHPGTLTTASGTDIDFIPAGAVPVSGASMLLDREIAGLVGTWRGAYDVIIVDSTALAMSAGTLGLAREADAVVLAGRKNRTRLRAVSAAVTDLTRAGARSVVTVLVETVISNGFTRAAAARAEDPDRLERHANKTSRAQVVQRGAGRS